MDERDRAFELCIEIAEKWKDYATTPQARTVADAIAREIKAAYGFAKAMDLDRELKKQRNK